MSTTTHEVLAAYIDCRENKRTTEAAREFELGLADNVRSIRNDLNDGSYKIGRSICFVSTDPTPREVWASSFRDRVVHHLLYNRIADDFIKGFSPGSSACIKGRGTFYGSQRLERFILSGTESWQKQMYYLQLDISNFFLTIQKDILAGLLAKKIECEWTLKYVLMTLYHDPTKDCIIKSPPALFRLIPPHKSLFNTPPFMGLQVGDLPSQFDANVYMDRLDQFVEHKLKPFGYVRYVDDFVLVDHDIDLLKAAKDEIEQFLWQELNLIINPTKTKLDTVYSGVDFVGRVILPWRTIPRDRLHKRAYQRLRTGTAAAEGLTSTLGLLRQSKSFYTRKNICRQALRNGFAVDWHGRKVYEVQKR